METEGEQIARKLTDDRSNPDLLVFEKTWGHRLLAGLSIALLIVGCVFIAYCAYGLANLAAVGLDNITATFGFVLYTAGLACGVLVLPPGLLGVYVAKHPKLATAAIVAAGVAFALLAAFAVAAMGVEGAQPFSVGLYVAAFAVCPALYLAAAIKVRRS